MYFKDEYSREYGRDFAWTSLFHFKALIVLLSSHYQYRPLISMQAANRLQKALKKGDTSFGAWQMLPGANLPRTICRSANNVDWLLVDLEHGNNSDDGMHDITAAAAACGVSTHCSCYWRPRMDDQASSRRRCSWHLGADDKNGRGRKESCACLQIPIWRRARAWTSSGGREIFGAASTQRSSHSPIRLRILSTNKPLINHRGADWDEGGAGKCRSYRGDPWCGCPLYWTIWPLFEHRMSAGRCRIQDSYKQWTASKVPQKQRAKQLVYT